MKNIIIVTLLLITATSCLKNKAEPIVEIDLTDTSSFPCGDTVFYSTQIKANIIDANCSGCHTNGGTEGGYSLDNYTEISAASTQILGTIRHEYKPMPAGGAAKLNDSLITAFDCWVKQGKKNN